MEGGGSRLDWDERRIAGVQRGKGVRGGFTLVSEDFSVGKRVSVLSIRPEKNLTRPNIFNKDRHITAQFTFANYPVNNCLIIDGFDDNTKSNIQG